MIDYLWVAAAAAVVVAAAAAVAGRLAPSSAPTPLGDKPALRILLPAVVVCAAVYTGLSFWRYYSFYCGLWDLGIMDSAVRNTALFRGFLVDFRGPFDHFSPLMVLFVPLYWVADSPRTLLLAQSLLLASAAVPLFFFAKARLKDATAALVVAAAYLLNPYYSRVNLYDAHVECLFPLLFFLGWLCLQKGRPVAFLLLMNACLLVKEDFVLAVAGTGLLLLKIRGRRRLGALCVLSAVFWAVFAVEVYFPLLIHTPYAHTGRYPPLLGRDAAQTLHNLGAVAGMVFSGQALRVVISLLLPFAFLPLAAPLDALLLCGPMLLGQICSRFPHQQLFMSHYAAGMLGLLPVATVLGWSVIERAGAGRPAWRRATLAGAAAAAIACNVLFCDLPDAVYHQYIRGYNVRKQLGFLSVPFRIGRLAVSPHVRRVHEVIGAIPRDASVVAQNSLAYYFVRHRSVSKLPGPDGADAYLFDLPSHRGMESRAEYLGRLQALRGDPGYRCLVAEDGLYLFVPTGGGPRGTGMQRR